MEKTYDKRRLLKIKLKSLHEEVKIIRREEDRLKPAVRRGSAGAALMIAEMAHHRRWDIRQESRATLLAYGYLRGKTCEQIEPRVGYECPVYTAKRFERVLKMVQKYGAASVSADAQVRVWMGLDQHGFRKKVA